MNAASYALESVCADRGSDQRGVWETPPVPEERGGGTDSRREGGRGEEEEGSDWRVGENGQTDSGTQRHHQRHWDRAGRGWHHVSAG